jgi:oligopeptidase A
VGQHRLIKDILKLKQEEAHMLGFKNYAELSLATKMADTPKQVTDFLDTLAKRAKPYAERDMQELVAYAKKLGISDMQAWDVAYVSEKLREEKYAFSDQEVKQYFPESKVLARLVQSHRDHFWRASAQSRCPSVACRCQLLRNQRSQNKPIAYFYLDLYARNHKRGGAWMDEALPVAKKPMAS